MSVCSSKLKKRGFKTAHFDWSIDDSKNGQVEKYCNLLCASFCKPSNINYYASTNQIGILVTNTNIQYIGPYTNIVESSLYQLATEKCLSSHYNCLLIVY